MRIKGQGQNDSEKEVDSSSANNLHLALPPYSIVRRPRKTPLARPESDQRRPIRQGWGRSDTRDDQHALEGRSEDDEVNRMIFEKHTTVAVESTQSKILKPQSDGWSRKCCCCCCGCGFDPRIVCSVS